METTLKILHFSTHNEECGIGKYQEMFLEALKDYDNLHNEFFDLSPNQTKLMSPEELDAALRQLSKQLEDFDILHIQHEFSFFTKDELRLVCDVAKKLRKKIIITVHTSPDVVHKKPHLDGLGPRSFIHYLRAMRREVQFHRGFTAALKQADIVLVHNEATKLALTRIGINPNVISKIVIPVPEISHTVKSQTIKQHLNVKEGDIVYCTVGFLHKYKGIKEAIKALDFLPSHYKLAIIGGVHPFTDSEDFYDEVTDLIVSLKLEERIYITGYIEEDEKLNALIRECDVCIFAYEKNYYSNVSSASLNNGFANHVPVVAYPTLSFIELNKTMKAMTLTKSFSYYELARSLREIDLVEQKKVSTNYARSMSYPLMAKQLSDIYKKVSV